MNSETYVLFYSKDEGSYAFFRKNDTTQLKTLPLDAVEIWSVQARTFEIAQLRQHEYLSWEPYKPVITRDADLIDFLPKDKFDIENAALLRNLGYPTIRPIMRQLLEWLQDMNWPVAQFIAPWILTIGVELYPYFEEIFQSNDSLWKNWVLTALIDEMPIEMAQRFSPLLQQLSQSQNEFDITEGVPEIAKAILTKIRSS